jgi:threonine dehydratase
MPFDAPLCKVTAVHAYGANIVRCEPQLRAQIVQTMCEQQPALVMVHPSAALNTVLGAGTACLEGVLQVKDLMQRNPQQQEQHRSNCPDAILVPVGGGGLLAGSVLGAHHIPVWGCEPRAAGEDARLSWRSGHVHKPITPTRTVADGLRTYLEGDALDIIHHNTAGILEYGDVDVPSHVCSYQLSIGLMSLIFVTPSTLSFNA